MAKDDEIQARTWAARERIAEIAYALVDDYGLDPSLAEAVEEARKAEDTAAFYEAYAALSKAVLEARG